MNIIYKTILLLILLPFVYLKVNAQCSFFIPSDVSVISHDTSITNSFLPGAKFFVCPDATLTVYGNSTGFNKFFIEGTVVFSDSVGATPYGMYSFYVKSGGTLHYNSSSSVSFPFLDTLYWENGAMLIDTGSLFHLDSICNPIVFNTVDAPQAAACASTGINKIQTESSLRISPNPFSDQLNIQYNNSSLENEITIYDLLGKELEHFYLNEATESDLEMKNNWSGIAILEIRNKNGEIHFEKIIRL